MDFNYTAIENISTLNWTSTPHKFGRTRHPPVRGSMNELPALLPLSILIVLTNGFVFVLFIKRKKLRTPANYLLVSLAVADFITGTVNIPLFITFLATLDRKLLMIFDPFSKLTAILTAYHILVVTAEKYVAIVKPLKHHSANPKMFFIVLGSIWLISIAISVVPSLWLSIMDGKIQPLTRAHLQLGHDLFCFVFVFLIPYIFIVYAQIIMFRAIARSKRKNGLRRAVSSTARQRNSHCVTNEKKCLAIFASMAVLFAICWLPWFLLTFLATLTAVVKELLPIFLKPETMSLLKTFAMVRFSTSIINPILYTFFKRDFMNACKSFFHCGLSRHSSRNSMFSYKTSHPNLKRPERRRLTKRTQFVTLENTNEQLANNSTSEVILMQVTSV